MTRKELAMAIAAGQIKKQNLTNITISRFANNLLNGLGAMKAHSKASLENWYNNLLADGFIA